MTSSTGDPRVHRLAAPISAASPAGESISHDGDFDDLRREIAKIESLTGDPVDWESVVRLGAGLLRRSKDLRVAAYLAQGLFAVEGLAGLAVGLAVIEQLTRTLWDDMHPPANRVRGRVNILTWLLSRVAADLEGRVVGEADRQDLSRVLEAANAMVRELRRRLADKTPAVRPLLNGIERLCLSLPPAPSIAPPPKTVAIPGGQASASRALSDKAPLPPKIAPPAPTPAPAKPDLRARAEPWLSPISATSPAGDDLRHDPEYVAVRDEISKLESLTGGEVEWALVVKKGEQLLRSQTKDLTLACYVARGQLEERGLDGLATGLLVVAGLCERYWETMHPPVKRVRRRGNAIDWLVQQIVPVIEGHRPTAAERGAVTTLAEAAAIMVKVSRQRLESSAPALGPLLKAIERMTLSLPPAPKPRPVPATTANPTTKPATSAAQPPPQASQARVAAPVGSAESVSPGATAPSQEAAQAATQVATETPPQPNQTAPETPPATAGPSSSAASPVKTPTRAPQPASKPLGKLPDPPPQAPSTPGEAVQFLGRLGTTIASTSSLLRAANVASPSAYRLLRTALYLHMDSPPPATSGKTSLPPLPSARRQKLEQMLASSNFAALLEESEESLRQFRFCLDLHRLSATSLAGLGHQQARDAVVGGVAALIRRMPTLPELAASDGSPLADAETRSWLAAEITSAPAGDEVSHAGGDDDPLRSLAADARSLARRGDLDGGLKLLGEHLSVGGGRRRFLARLACAEVAVIGGQRPLARALYIDLAEESARIQLDDWDPALALRCLTGLFELNTSSAEEPALRDPTILSRLSRIDPHKAAELLRR